MNTPAISIKGLVKRYGDTTAVAGISLEIGQGEVFGLLGPNGAGKTTTILMLLGLTEITEGQVSVLGLDPRRHVLELKRQVGYMPDAVGFYDNLSAYENMMYSARLAGIPSTQRRERIERALASVSLADVAHRPVATFSRGMRQRLGLAEIRMKQVRIAILDEPTSGLDPLAAEEFLKMIDTLRHEGVCVVLSSHMLDHMQRICDRVALFHQGRIVLCGSVGELANQVLGGNRYVRVQAERLDVADVLRAIQGVQSVERAEPGYRVLADRDVRADIAQAVVQAGASLMTLDESAPSLDVIYNQYFQQLQEVRNAA
jgi:ABC-2 type transport system ATP-binding protein